MVKSVVATDRGRHRASAGGLEALRELVSQLDFHPRLAYVVVQHLSPTHKSMLTTLLSRECKLKVADIHAAQKLEPDTIYIVPPNKDAEIRDGVLELFTPKLEVGPKPSVNRFFASLAEDQKERAVGVILSGTGADGSVGIGAIKKMGGLTIVQEPGTAKYDGMPQAAINSNEIDLVLPPARIGPALASYATEGSLNNVNSEHVSNGNEYQQIITYMRDVSSFDLRQYKVSTIERRIKRRMSSLGFAEMSDYLARLKTDREEILKLAQEVLISVTEFFRDSNAFVELANVIKELVRKTPTEQPLRVWVPGCATGEEAYSIGILFEEAIRESGRARKYQIFATDIDAKSTTIGRMGKFTSAALKHIDKKLCQRYFEKTGNDYTVVKVLREKMVFSVHNLAQDPPFSRIDLVSCRNLLIYFTPALQKRVMEIFHYALNPDGIIFLGKSETVTQHEDLFQPLVKSARLFQKVGDKRFFRPFSVMTDLSTVRLANDINPRSTPHDALGQHMRQVLVDAYAPPAIVVSANDELFHTFGNVQAFLSLHSGPAGLNVFELIGEPMRAELRALVYKCRREKVSVTGGRHLVKINGEETPICMAVRPVPGVTNYELLIIAFETIPAVAAGKIELSSALSEHPVILELEHELTTTREHLQTVVEELETSNEELQSVNEELQSANEELQSTNEELQTSNEELQSTNEELLTVNDELQAKTHELENLATDLLNIQNNINFPMIVVDKQQRVVRFVPEIDKLVPLAQVQAGQSLATLPWRGEMPKLRQTVQDVIVNGTPYHDRVTVNNRVYNMSVVPYRLKNSQIAGALLLFPDVSELHAMTVGYEVSQKSLQNLIDHIVDGVITMDQSGTVLSFSRAAQHIFGYAANEVIGENIRMLMPAPEAAKHDQYLQNYVKSGDIKALGKQREVRGRKRNGEVFPVELSVKEMKVGEQSVFTGLVRDITERRKTEDALYREKELAQITLYSIADGVIRTNAKGEIEYMNPVAEKLTGWNNSDVLDEPLNRVFRLIDEATHEPMPNPVALALKSEIHMTNGTAILLRNRLGEEFSIEYSIAAIRNQDQAATGVVVVFHDISSKKDLLQQMAWQARHDPLTGLVNRHEIEVRLEHALTSAKSFQREHALLYIDLDQFKIVNDTCGHRAGDELLRQVASQFAANLRHRDTLSRLGGDEFAVLLENCSLIQAQHLAEKMKDLIQDFRFLWEDKIFRIGVSIGVSSITEKTLNVAEILSNADAACYAAKESGRNRVETHSQNNAELTQRRSEMLWVSNINQVMDEGRFRLYFQQIKPLQNNKPPHWEVLLRLIDSEGHLVLPGVFLPAAERYGLMSKIDRWVLRSVLSILHDQEKNERDEHLASPMVSINISGSSLGDQKFLAYAQEQFSAFATNPRRVCFEITETTAIANFAKAKNFIAEMKKLGCSFALDDFGSGMSSFGYLKSLAVDYLKIDGSFVKNLNLDLVDLAMVEAINRIGHIMEIQTVAEFADSDKIIERLRKIGVDYAQGFSIQQPIPLAEFISHTRKRVPEQMS